MTASLDILVIRSSLVDWQLMKKECIHARHNTKIRKEIILNITLCGVLLKLQAKKSYNYWSIEQNKWKMVFRSTTVDVESCWSAESWCLEHWSSSVWSVDIHSMRRAGQAGWYKIFLMRGAYLPLCLVREGTHWSFYTFITHLRLPPPQQFSALQDADSLPLALSCPWSQLHSWSNETQRHYSVHWFVTTLFLNGGDSSIPVDGEVDLHVGHVHAKAVLVPLWDHYVEFVWEFVYFLIHIYGEYNTLFLHESSSWMSCSLTIYKM